MPPGVGGDLGVGRGQMPAPPKMDQGEPGDGTQQSGYVTPDLGPFECDNCVHFQAPSACDHPEVVSDPEVNGQVDAKGCCNFFKSQGGQSGAGASDNDGDEAQEAGAAAGSEPAGTTAGDSGGYA